MDQIKIYTITLPEHLFLHIKNYDSHGYWDFWEKQEKIPGQDCDTICGLLDGIRGKLDGEDDVYGKFSGQIVGYIYEPDGRTPEAYGVRLPADYEGPLPDQMLLLEVPESDYLVFEHGPFDYEKENDEIWKALQRAVDTFDYENTGWDTDEKDGRIAYFYYDSEKYMKRLKPIKQR